MPVSKKILHEMQKGSWIRKMFEEGIKLKKEFGAKNVFDLSLGNPEIEPPQEVVNALKKLAINPTPGIHRYMPNSGIEDARQAVANSLNKESDVKLSAKDIVMTCGAAGGLNISLKAMLNAGDEIIIFAPYFVEYTYYADNHGLKCVIAETDDNFIPIIKSLENLITQKTSAVLINTPNNPTGAVYDEKCIKGLANILNKKNKELGKNILLILDDAYQKIVYEGKDTPCVFNYYTDSIIIASYSKTLSIPGERIGYVAVNPKAFEHDQIMAALAFCNRTLGFVNAPALMQNIISETAEIIVDINIYKQKRNLLYNGLIEAGYNIILPRGAFYLFPKTPIEDDIAFVQRLLKERVLAVPGSGFGRKGYMRLSYCVDDNVIKGAIEGLKKAI